ncbi:MAG: tryptophan synthase subunit alpha [Verrucomicrobiota bacterium]
MSEPAQDRISRCFADCQAAGRAAFVSYTCACDPDPATSLEVCRALLESGTDILELGVPFSDPLADGQTNQLAAERALAAGARHGDVLELVRRIRGFSQAPIVFYTYYNVVFAQGTEVYVRRAREAGVDALLVLDLPPEEATEYLEICQRLGMGTVFIVAPTTPPERIKRIAQVTTSFVYYVSRAGVTGERETLADDLAQAVARIKAEASVPVVVGFGISSPEQVRTVAQSADGVVVGSAIVNCIGHNLDQPERILPALREKVSTLSAPLHSKE